MAFVKKTWVNRISEYPNRRIINDGYVTKQVTVARDEGVVTQEGDSFTAENMNDLEERIYNATRGGGGGGASSLEDLSDVAITTPTDGQALIYDSTAQKWKNASGGGASSLNDLTDVAISSPAIGQVLTYNGASWANGIIASPWIDVTGTLTAGSTTITFSDVSISSNSTIDVYTDVFGVNPTDITVATGSVTLTFASQADDLGVKVRIS